MSDLEELAYRAVESGKGRGHAPTVANLLAELCGIVAALSVRVAAVEAHISQSDYEPPDLEKKGEQVREVEELESVKVVASVVADVRELDNISTREATSELGELTTDAADKDDAIAMMRISEEVSTIFAEREENVANRFESLRRAGESDKKKIRELFKQA